MNHKIPESYFIYQQLISNKGQAKINLRYAEQLTTLSDKINNLKDMIRAQVKSSTKCLAKITALEKSVS